MQVRQSIHSDHAKQLNTQGLRNEFLVETIFKENAVTMTYSHIDRIIFGGICPLDMTVEIPKEVGKEIGVNFLLERREMGIINIGGKGVVTVDGQTYELGHRDALYIGKGAETLTFKSCHANEPAKFYFCCAPAHTHYDNKKINHSDIKPDRLGNTNNCNVRTINKYIVPDTVTTCQLTMGLTELDEGSLWNTMPSHTHERRMEVYFYFNLGEEDCVFHMMGQPKETRHIIIRNEQAVISPSWSIHSGVGTKNYSFIWGMVGENQVFDDMDHLKISELE